MKLVDPNIDFDSYANRDPIGPKVISASNYEADIVDEFYGEKATGGVKMPWSDLHWFKFRSHEVSIWSGYNGHGKSLVLGQVMLSAMQQEHRVCIASMEMTPASTLHRMARQAIRSYTPPREMINRFSRWTDDRLWIFDQMGSVSWNRMVGVVRYAVENLGIQHFVIDSLMKCGIAPDDYTTESQFVEELCSIAKSTGVHIHLVHHGRKPMNENTRMSKYEIRGSGQISDKVDNVVIISRNKKKERELMYTDHDPEIRKQPDAWITIDKQRHGTGEEGDFPLYYSKEATSYSARQVPEPIFLIDMGEYEDEHSADNETAGIEDPDRGSGSIGRVQEQSVPCRARRDLDEPLHESPF